MADSSTNDKTASSVSTGRRYFGTDGVRGIVGDGLTATLVEQLGTAATVWAGGGSVLVGRDTRGSGAELEAALARGIAAGGGTALLGGVLPTPAVALLADDLGLVVSASHNPPEYNGVKVFARGGQKLGDAEELAIEALLGAPSAGESGAIREEPGLVEQYVEHVVEHFGSDLSGLSLAVDCANGAYAAIAPAVFERLGATVTPLGTSPDGTNINDGCGATDLALLSETVRAGGLDLGVAFDGDGDRMLAVDADGTPVDGDQIIAIIALAMGVDLVAVTSMTNLGFHRLMEERGVSVLTTDVGDRYVLEALRREGGIVGGEQSGHVIVLDGHVTGDGLAAALGLCRSLDGRALAEAAAVMPRFAQVLENVRVSRLEVPAGVLEAVEELNRELAGSGRILVRPSGTEPVVRVLAESSTETEAATLCGRVADLVRKELGAS